MQLYPSSNPLFAGRRKEYTVMGLESGALYEVAVKAFNRAGPGPLSSPGIVRKTLYDGE